MTGFECSTLKEEFFFNADEIHFVIYLNNEQPLPIKEDRKVRYTEVISEDLGMTMMFMLGEGSKAHLQVPLIIFQNDCCYYPIQSVPDNVLGFCYRT